MRKRNHLWLLPLVALVVCRCWEIKSKLKMPWGGGARWEKTDNGMALSAEMCVTIYLTQT